VILIIHRIRVVIHRVDTANVIDVSVTIIVDSVSGYLARIHPDIGGEVRMVIVDAGIDYSHHYGG
jgi:hypothetical protein